MSKEKQDKNWFARHRVLTVIGILVLLVTLGTAISGGGSETGQKVDETNNSSSSEEQTVFKVGDVIEFDGKKVTVTSVERNWNSGNQFITPNSGNEFIKTQISIENSSNSEVPYNTFDWKIQDSQGVIKDVASAAFGVDGALGSGNLAPKGKVAGFLVFEVPSGDQELTLRYNPSFWSDKKIEIKL